jgi:hypothetical protein
VITNEQRRVRGALRALTRPWMLAMTESPTFVAGLLKDGLIGGATVIGCVGRPSPHIEYVDTDDAYLLTGMIRSVVADFKDQDLFLYAVVDQPYDIGLISQALAVSMIHCTEVVGVAIIGDDTRDALRAAVMQYLA